MLFLFAYTALVQAENNASAAGTAQLTLAPATLSAGTNATLSFDLVNSLSVTALQFDVILPEGLSVNTIINEDEEEVPAITLTDRKRVALFKLQSTGGWTLHGGHPFYEKSGI